MSNAVHIDHTPGGSPVGKAAPAPIYRTVNIRAELLGATEHTGEHVDADHVWRTCKAAAAMGMRNADKYGAEDRADAAADAVARLWVKAGYSNVVSCRRCSAPASNLCKLETGVPGIDATVPMCLHHSGRAIARTPIMRNAPTIPADACTFTHALNAVANYRRSLDARRVRDTQHAADSALERDFAPSPELEITQRTTAPDAVGTPAGARKTAVWLLRSAGVLGETVEHGPLWTLAYTVARASIMDVSTGELLGQADIATELELTVNTHRSHLNRAAKRLAAQGFTPNDWRDALEVISPTGKTRAASLPLSATGEGEKTQTDDDWRTRVGQRIANADAPAVADAPIIPVHGPTLAPSSAPAEWTGYLSPITAARLARAAELRDAGMRARTQTERTMVRRAAGMSK